jgi:hypothetical protein
MGQPKSGTRSPLLVDEMPSQPALDETFLAAFDSSVRKYGYKDVMRSLEMRHFQLGAQTGGRPPIDDAERRKRMEYHLLNDRDLVERKRDGDKRLLSEGARRAICDLPRDGDLKPDGTPWEKAVDRLVSKFPFAFGIGGRGFNQGCWDRKRSIKQEAAGS